MKSSYQFRLCEIFNIISIASAIVWLAMLWWQLCVLLCLTMLPSVILVWVMERSKRDRDSTWLRISLVFSGLSIGFLLLYVLSIGPAIYIDRHVHGDVEAPSWMLKLYEPLGILNSPFNPFQSTIEWYAQNWTNI